MKASSYDPAKYDGTNASLASAVSPDSTREIVVKYRIPPRCGVAIKLQAGQQLRVENTHGSQVCDFWAYLAVDMGHFLSMSHCQTWLQSVSPKIGDKLVTNCRQPVLEIISDTVPGDAFGLKALEDSVAVMSACPQDKNPINGADAKPAEIHFIKKV